MITGLRLNASPNSPQNHEGYLELDRNLWGSILPELLTVNSIELMIYQECNMSCVYCYGQDRRYGDGGFMSQETAYKAVDWYLSQLPEDKEVKMAIFGGEPLLNFPLLREIVRYIKEKVQGRKTTFGITTNGTLFTDEIINFFAAEEIHPLVSFDGPAEYQRASRKMKNGQDSHYVVRQNILKVKERLPETSLCATIYKDADKERILTELRAFGLKNYQAVEVSPCLLDETGKQTVTIAQPEPGNTIIDIHDDKPIHELSVFIQMKEQAIAALQDHDTEKLRKFPE